MQFEWDEKKAEANLHKHGVSFGEARSVYEDILSAILPDEDHSIDEERWLALGMSNRFRVLVVCFGERGSKIRIISARKATKQEIKKYES
ncbi:MAG: BrnT family toxin [Calditrichota bacterium]